MHTFDTNLRFTGANSPLTSNYTCGSGATVLCLGIVTGGSVLRSSGAPTYNGVALTQAGQTWQYATNPETSCELWYLLSPPTTSAYQISVPNADSLPLYVQASSYKAATGYSSIYDGVNGKTGSGVNPYVYTAWSTQANLIVAVLGNGYDTAPTSQNGTNLNRTDDGTYSDSNQYHLAYTVLVNWTCTTDDYGIIAVAFKESLVGVLATPSVLTATLTVKAPTIVISHIDTVQSLTLSLYAPSIWIVNDDTTVFQTVFPTVQSLSLSLGTSSYLLDTAPIISAGVILSALALNAPTVVIDYTFSDDVDDHKLTLTLKDPEIKFSSSFTATVLTLSLSQKNINIAIQENRTIVVSKLSLTSTIIAPNTLAPLPIIRMIPFIYSPDISYMMEFGEEYVRFYYNGSPLMNGTSHIEIVTPYQSEDLLQLAVEQLGDTMWITHDLYPPAKLTRTTAISFAYTVIPFTKGPFLTRNDIENDDDVTMMTDVTAKDNLGILTCSEDKFTSEYIGSLFSLTHPRINLKTEGTKLTTETGQIGEAIEVYGDWNLFIQSTNGYGTVRLQRSTNDWLTSTDIVAHTCVGTESVTHTGTETIEDVKYRINVTAHTSGTIFASLVVNTGTVSGSLTTIGIIKVPLKVPKGDFTFNTHGTWAATVVLERNENDAGWEAYRTFVGDSDRNVQFAGTESEDNVSYRINITAYTSGTVKADLTASASTKTGIVKIDSIVSGTQANVTILSDIASATATKRWAEGAWSIVRGYPTSITFFEDRAVYAGKTKGKSGLPSNVWLSHSGDYENFEEGVKDSDAFWLGVTSTNSVKWIKSVESLLLGTSGDEWKISSNKLEGALTPAPVPSVKQQLSYGSKDIQAIRVNDVILFVDSCGRKIRECVFNGDVDKFVAPDLTAFAEHITFSGITCISHQKNPDSILWCVLANGNLISMTYVREQNIISWARHPIDGIVQSIAVIPTSGEDEVWISVVRAIDGDTEVYIEQFQPRYYGVRKENAFFVDSGVVYNGVLTTSLTGYDHLEGKVVYVLGDGVEYRDLLVDNGTVTLTTSVLQAIGGLPYTSKIQPMRMDVNTPMGTSHGSKKKIPELVLSFVDTMNVKYGVSNTTLFDIDWTNIEWVNSSLIEGLFTGDVVVALDGGFSMDDPILISTDSPLPMTLRAIIPRMDITSR